MDQLKIIIDEYKKYLAYKFGLIKRNEKIGVKFKVKYPETEEEMICLVSNILYRSLFKNSIYYREEYRELFEKYIDDIV